MTVAHFPSPLALASLPAWALCLLALFLFGLFARGGQAAEFVPVAYLGPDFQTRTLNDVMQVLEDQAAGPSPEDVAGARQWRTFGADMPVLADDSRVWFRVRLRNAGPARTLLLGLDDPRVDYISVYTMTGGMTVEAWHSGIASRLPAARCPIATFCSPCRWLPVNPGICWSACVPPVPSTPSSSSGASPPSWYPTQNRPCCRGCSWG